MLRALLFDMGGTLDGGGHWLDRFAALYANAGLRLSRERVRAAFDEAERRALADDAIATCGLEAMVPQHVTWPLEHLDTGAELQTAPVTIVQRFVTAVRDAAVDNARMLADLSARGLKLGV